MLQQLRAIAGLLQDNQSLSASQIAELKAQILPAAITRTTAALLSMSLEDELSEPSEPIVDSPVEFVDDSPLDQQENVDEAPLYMEDDTHNNLTLTQETARLVLPPPPTTGSGLMGGTKGQTLIWLLDAAKGKYGKTNKDLLRKILAEEISISDFRECLPETIQSSRATLGRFVKDLRKHDYDNEIIEGAEIRGLKLANIFPADWN